MSAGTRRDGVDSIFFCSWCQTMFEDRKSLSDHMRSGHSLVLGHMSYVWVFFTFNVCAENGFV